MKKIGLIFSVFATVALVSTNVMACSDPAHCKCKNHNSKKGMKHSHNPNHVNTIHKPNPNPVDNIVAPGEVNTIHKLNPNPPLVNSCKADGMQYLVGKNKSVLATMKFANQIRIEEPGMMYTMEYSAERTRIITNEKGIITSVICG